MSNEALMTPQEFAERLERGFVSEPPHALAEEDLGRGRRRLRRRRAGTTLAALTTLGVIGASAFALPGIVGPDRVSQVAPAAGGAMTPAEITATCMRKENVSHYADGHAVAEAAALALMGTKPRLLTSAVIADRSQATLISEDGRYWGLCQFRNAPDNGVKNMMVIYPTDVSFPRQVVDGVPAYEVPSANDPRLEGTASISVPQLETPCAFIADGAADRRAGDARCPEFTVHWTDRRPAEVAAVRVTTPDGVSSWADVRRGYLSFAYTGTMTPDVAEQIARGDGTGATRVVFYDKDGEVLVDDRDPGHLPADGRASIANFPSLAWWTK